MRDDQVRLSGSYEEILTQADRYYRAGDLATAIDLYRRVADRLAEMPDRILERRPNLRDWHRQARWWLANCLQQAGRYAEAIEVEEVLLRTDPEESDTWRQQIALLRVVKGDVDAGLAELREQAEKSQDPDAWLILGRETRIEGRLSASQQALDRALELCQAKDCDKLAEIHYQRFLLSRDLDQIDEALASWEEAAGLSDELALTIRDAYTLLIDAGRYSEALSYLARDENPLQAGLYRGLVANLTGDPVGGRQEWQKVAALDPNNFGYGQDAWVEVMLRLRRPRPALEWLQTALQEHFTPRMLVLAGIAWAMEGDREVASSLFQQAINLQRYQRRPKQKLDSADWRLFNSLVSDKEMKQALKSYFAVIETLWG